MEFNTKFVSDFEIEGISDDGYYYSAVISNDRTTAYIYRPNKEFEVVEKKMGGLNILYRGMNYKEFADEISYLYKLNILYVNNENEMDDHFAKLESYYINKELLIAVDNSIVNYNSNTGNKKYYTIRDAIMYGINNSPNKEVHFHTIINVIIRGLELNKFYMRISNKKIYALFNDVLLDLVKEGYIEKLGGYKFSKIKDLTS